MKPSLHDWTLEDIKVNWPTKAIRIRVVGYVKAGYEEEVIIVVKSFFDIAIPRHEEWGGSKSINKIVGPDKLDDKSVLKIEMQTGDMLTIIAQSIEILPPISIKLQN